MDRWATTLPDVRSSSRWRVVNTWNGGALGRVVVFTSTATGEAGHNECFAFLIRHQSASFDNATTHQGYDVEPIPPRIEFGAVRTICECDACAAHCTTKPGYLCGDLRPRRKRVTRTDRPTRRQQVWLDRIAADFGGTLAIERHGSRLWVTAENEARDFMQDGTTLYGSIGARGKVKLTIGRFLGDAEIRDLYDWTHYAPVKAIRDALNAEELRRCEEWLRRNDERLGVEVWQSQHAPNGSGSWLYQLRDGDPVGSFATEREARIAARAALEVSK